MAYTAPVFTAVTGATILASQHNTYLRDNLAAIWVYTTAGDIVYATSATALARLGIGAQGSILTSTGTAPQWAPAIGAAAQVLRANATATGLEYAFVGAYAVAGLSAPQNIGTTDTMMAWNTDIDDGYGWHDPVTNNNQIKPGVAGVYIASCFLNISLGTLDQLSIWLNNFTLISGQRGGTSGDQRTPRYLAAVSYPVLIGATDFFNVTANDNDATKAVQTTSWFAVHRIR